MDRKTLEKQWLAEEAAAHIHGWDFSHIHGRYDEERDLPWDYEKIVRSCLSPEKKLLDQDTGGGEFLLSLGHPPTCLSATEAYPPNAALCRKTLLPLGVDFREADCHGPLPFDENTFDLVLNRHGNYTPAELRRVLKPGGYFITEQVGAENDRELVTLLLGPGIPLPFPEQYLACAQQALEHAGFQVIQSDEAFRPIRFWDVGALVWFAHIIPWEFPDFSVARHLPALYRAQEILEQNGVIEGTIHRYLIVAQKDAL